MKDQIELKMWNHMLLEYLSVSINNLASITFKLVESKREQRKGICRELIKQLNNSLIQTRQDCKFERLKFHLFRGIVVPVVFEDQTRLEQIVNILHDQTQVFSTKTRAPYKIVVETLELDDTLPNEVTLFDNMYKSKLDKEQDIFFDNFKIKDKENDSDKDKNTNMKEENKLKIENYLKSINTYENNIKKEEVEFHKYIEIIDDKFDYKAEIFKDCLHYNLNKIVNDSEYNIWDSHRIREVIVKGGDDLLQEEMVSRLMMKLNDIFSAGNLKVALKPMAVFIASGNSGFIEFVSNTVSLDYLKSKFQVENESLSLKEIYRHLFKDKFLDAQYNFLKSVVANSLFTYIFQAKDRHNGNILLDIHGNVIHIDFGFLLTTSPRNMNFESSPFKLTSEYVDLLDGEDSELYTIFRQKFIKGFLMVRERYAELISLLDSYYYKENKLDCFLMDTWLNELKERLKVHDHQLNMSVESLTDYLIDLICESYDNWRTIEYDRYQWITNKIYY